MTFQSETLDVVYGNYAFDSHDSETYRAVGVAVSDVEVVRHLRARGHKVPMSEEGIAGVRTTIQTARAAGEGIETIIYNGHTS